METRDFSETVMDRAVRDGAFRRALLREAVVALVAGDVRICRIVLRDYTAATVRRLKQLGPWREGRAGGS